MKISFENTNHMKYGLRIYTNMGSSIKYSPNLRKCPFKYELQLRKAPIIAKKITPTIAVMNSKQMEIAPQIINDSINKSLNFRLPMISKRRQGIKKKNGMNSA